MQTQHLVQASADVVTITTLRAGDVYKRLEKRYNDEYVARIGIVQTVDFNGEDAMISALELTADSVEHKVFGTATDLKIFAATPDEVTTISAELRRTLESRVSSCRRQLDDATNALERFHEIAVSLESGALQAAQTGTVTSIEGRS